MSESISIIVTTYNWPQALGLVLKSLDIPTEHSYEVIVADDGSGPETEQLIRELKPTLSYPLEHVWQGDRGFRAAACRNKAVLKSKGDYLVFLDGDCIVREDFIEQHVRLKEAGWFVRGNRVKLNNSFSQNLLASQSLNQLRRRASVLANWGRGNITRLFPLLTLPLGKLRYLKKADWFGVKTCNLGVFREDFNTVNGFNEDFEGWGHEDADLAIRLIRKKIFRKEGAFSTAVFHCHHHEADKHNQKRNRQMLDQSFAGDIVVKNGLIKQ